MSLRRHRGHWRWIAAAVTILILTPAAALSAASDGAAGGRILVRPEFYLTSIANHDVVNGKAASYDRFAATAELTIVAPGRRFRGGPFVDYRTSSDSRFADNLSIGGYFRYNWPRWDATAWVFSNRSPDSETSWIYATRLRYLVVPGRKVGIETLAPVEHHAGRPRLMLGYYGALTESLTLKLLAGAGTSGTPDASARVELVWRVR